MNSSSKSPQDNYLQTETNSSKNLIQLFESIKHKARILHRSALNADEAAIRCLRSLREFSHIENSEISQRVQRRHCLSTIAQILGFNGWPPLKALLIDRDFSNLGQLMFKECGGAYWNIWVASYDEAQNIRAAHSGFLLGYKHQFFIVEEHYIRQLGINPGLHDWDILQRNWARPKDVDAWARLTKLAVEIKLKKVPE